jgi:hypothetical protein
VENVKYFISCRDRHDFPCKVLVRMVRQRLNFEEWDEYRAFWSRHLRPEKGDAILAIDVHNIGGRLKGFEQLQVPDYHRKAAIFDQRYQESNAGMCPDLFHRLSIFVSGDVALCSADQSSYFNLGNVLVADPVTIFNNEVFTSYREAWVGGHCRRLAHCRTCTIAISRANRTLPDVGAAHGDGDCATT